MYFFGPCDPSVGPEQFVKQFCCLLEFKMPPSCNYHLASSGNVHPQSLGSRRTWSMWPRCRRACHPRSAVPHFKINEAIVAEIPADNHRQFRDLVLGGTARAVTSLAAAMLVLSSSPAGLSRPISGTCYSLNTRYLLVCVLRAGRKGSHCIPRMLTEFVMHPMLP